MPVCTNLVAVSAGQRIVEVFTTPSLTLFLLIGSAVLAISLLILTLTRVGHARPITKCVILSVIAHILLLGYAYGTKLMFEFPVAQPQAPVKVQLIGFEQESQELPETEDPVPLDHFIVDLLQSETEPLQRPVADVPFELERIFDVEGDVIPVLKNQIPEFEPMKTAEFQDDNFQPNPLDQQPDFPQDDPSTSIEPEAIEFARRGDGEKDVRDHQPAIEANNQPIGPASELQDVEFEPTIVNRNSFPDEHQRVEQFESELVVPDAEHALVDLFAASTGVDPETAKIDSAGEKRPANIEQLIQVAAQTRRLGDGQAMPVAFQLRSPATRTAAAQLRGGSEETEVAVEAALKWLAATQKETGNWCPRETEGGREDKVYGHDRGGCGENADAGITALATLAFLGAGHTHLEGPYQSNVQRALEYLTRHQAIDGDLSGGAKLFARMYCHSMSLLALSEALAMTGDHRLKQPVQLGVGYTVQAQDKTGGGWRYQPGDKGDMSQFGWNVMSLHAARLGGIQIEPATISRMQTFLDSCRTGPNQGLASYRPGEGPSTTMTAEALACAHFLGVEVAGQSVQEARRRIVAELPTTSRINVYYWYYATLSLNQHPGTDWQLWNEHLQRVLLSQQESGGQNIGSWPPAGIWAGYGGRVYSTALSTLCLEAYYRYSPEEESAAIRSAHQKLPSVEAFDR